MIQAPSAIVLSLLNSVPVQNWTFTPEDIVRIGRATDNHVVLFSAVVSRHHAELRWSSEVGWQLANISPNGTYVDGEAIKDMVVVDGMVICLATSGPKIKIKVAVDNFATFSTSS
jgi:pSer/pThr/pTyr-binding forkhead associated (FHA) protein